jgi:outer membrane protein assembly complex protein YaeT
MSGCRPESGNRGVYRHIRRIGRALLGALAAWLLASHGGPADAREADVVFIGAGSFPAEKLRAALAEQLDTIAKSGLTTARADDAAWFLELFYRKQGFSKAEVMFEIRGSRLVLKVNEGAQTFVTGLKFVGNRTFTDETLAGYMVGVTKEELAEAKVPFNESEIAAGADRLVGFYASEGFLEAEVDTTDTRITGGRQGEIVVRIAEGARSIIGPIAFTGQPLLERRELLEALELKADAPFTPYTVDELQRVLRGFYRSRGYFAAKVGAVAGTARRGAVPITFLCEPGVRFRVGKVEPRGTDRLSPEFIEKRFASLAGRTYDPAKLEGIYRELMKTGLFRRLEVRPMEAGSGVLNLDVGIEEAKAKEVGVELGYGSYDGVSAGIRIGDRNFLGGGRPLSLGIEYSQRGLRGELLYVDPWLFDTGWRLRARLYSQLRDELGYSKVSEGVRVEFSRRPAAHFEAGAYFLAEHADISNLSIDPMLAGPTRYLLVAAGLTQTIDFRDDETNPTRGWVFTTSADIDALDGELVFARASVRYSWYRSFGRSLLGFGARAGWIIPIGDPAEVPVDLRFFNGGGTTVRSFVERRLGPEDAGGNPLGGESYTIFNLEWDFPIAGALGGAVFADAGNLQQDATFSLDDMRYAVGVGLRYQLPIGPLRIDYGYNPDRKAGERTGALHLSFGFAF